MRPSSSLMPIAVIGVLLLSLVATPSTADERASNSQAEPEPVTVNREEVSEGDVVAQGTENGNGCNLNMELITEAPPANDQTLWTALELNEQCEVVVRDKWEGDFEDRLLDPPQDGEALIDLLPVYESEPIPGSDSWDESSGDPLMSTTSTWSCKSSEHRVFTYGLGGRTYDKLTLLQGALRFCWNGSEARVANHEGSYGGANLRLWRWLFYNGRVTDFRSGPAITVYRRSEADYHCHPPGQRPCSYGNGYYHTLWERTTGWRDGNTTCTAGFHGTIVRGPYRETIQGCR